MKKLINPSYIALLIFILLGVFVIYIDKGKKIKEEKISIFTIKEEDVKTIEFIDTEKNTDIICNNTDNVWEITSPKKYLADKDVINNVIRNFANASVDRKITDEGKDIKNFGLDAPRIKIKVNTKGNKENILLIGNKTPTGNLYYAKDQNKNDVYTVYSYFVDDVNKDLKALKKKEVKKEEKK